MEQQTRLSCHYHNILMAKMKDLMAKMKDEMEKTTLKLSQEKSTESTPKWSEIVAQAVDSKLNDMKESIEKVNEAVEETKSQFDEQRDKESRQNNIIIYNSEEERTEDKEEWRKREIGFCMELFNSALEVTMRAEDIIKVIRLGKRTAGTKRPMLVQFKSKVVKNKVMESLWKLRKSDEKYRKLSICHDMTKKEREECKKMVALAKQKESDEGQGEYIFRVRGPPEKMTIVKIHLTARAQRLPKMKKAYMFCIQMLILLETNLRN